MFAPVCTARSPNPKAPDPSWPGTYLAEILTVADHAVGMALFRVG